MPAIYERRSRLWRCNFSIPQSFQSAQIVVCGVRILEQRKMFYEWKVLVCVFGKRRYVGYMIFVWDGDRDDMWVAV
jgi:hypothetical protein